MKRAESIFYKVIDDNSHTLRVNEETKPAMVMVENPQRWYEFDDAVKYYQSIIDSINELKSQYPNKKTKRTNDKTNISFEDTPF